MKVITAVSLSLFALSAFADASYKCEEARSGRSVRLEASKAGSKAALTLFSGNTMESSMRVRLESTVAKLDGFLRNNLRAMDKKEISSGDTTASFRIDGYDFAGNARLGVRISSPQGEFSLSSCTYLLPRF